MNPLKLRLLAVALALQRGLFGPDEAAKEVRALESGGAPAPQIPETLSGRLSSASLESLERELKVLGADEESAFRVVADSLPPSSGWHRLWGELKSDATVTPAGMDATIKAPAPPSESPNVRSILPKQRYEVRKELARGGMGRVLVAMDNLMGREVALKEMITAGDRKPPVRPATPGKSSGADFERFLREAKVTGQLEHPNIVPVYEIGQNADGTVFYTMKYVRGRTFAEALWQIARENSSRTAEERMNARLSLLDAFVQVCNAVAYAHSRGVINRDLKPANLILGDYGETLVLDWGLARVEGKEDKAGAEMLDATALISAARAATEIGGSSSEKLTVDGAVFGTPSYMPPEQARGRIDEVDEKSDVYALGAILFEILTAHAPYEGPNVAAILQSVLTVDPPRILKVEPEAPKELAALVERAMSRDRSKRLASAKEFAEEVKRFRDGRALASYTYSLREQFSRVLRKHRALATATAAAFVILVAGVLVSLYYANQAGDESKNARRAQQLADEARDKSQQRAESERLAREETQKALVRAQGERLAAVAKPLAKQFPAVALLLALRAVESAPGLTSNNALYESLLYLSQVRHFYWHDNGGRDVAWSPDNRRLATCGNDFMLRLWDVTTGAEIAHSDAHEGSVLGCSFSPDGRRLLSWSADATARLWDPETLRPIVTLDGHKAAIRGAKFSSDSSRLLTWSADGTARLWNLSAGTNVVFTSAPGEITADLSDDGSQVAATIQAGPAFLWSATDPGQPRRIGDDKHLPLNVKFSPDAKSLATVAAGGQVRIWDFATGTEKSTWEASRIWSERSDLRWSPDGKRIGTYGRDGMVAIQDSGTGSNPVVYRGNYDTVWAGNADWSRIVISSDRHQVIVYKGADLQPLETLGTHEYIIRKMRFSPDGKRIATISEDRTAIVWDVKPGRETPLLAGCAGSKMLSPCPDGRTGVFRLDGEGHVGVRDLETGETLSRWEGVLESRDTVQVDPQGKFAAVCYVKSGSVELRELRSGRIIRTVELEGSRQLNHATFNVTGTCLTCIGGQKRVVVVRVPDGTTLGDFPHPQHEAYNRQYGANSGDTSPDGKTTYTTLAPIAVVIAWETATGKELGRFIGHTGWTLHVRAFADGRHIVTTAADTSARLWNVATYEEVAIAASARIEETTPVPSPDGKWIGIFVDAGEVRLLSGSDLKEHLVLPFETAPSRLGFTTDSTCWLAPSANGTLRIVPLDLLSAARRAAPRELTPKEMSRYDVGNGEERQAYTEAWGKAHPSSVAYLLSALTLVKANRVEEAVARGRLAVSALPRHPETHSWFAQVLSLAAQASKPDSEERRKYLVEALAAARRALELRLSVEDLRATIKNSALPGEPAFEALLKEFTK